MQFDQYPREELRNRLTGLGIPRDKHHISLLQALLPITLDRLPFNGSDPDSVAEVLVFLMGKNIIQAPFDVNAVLDFAWGVHACQFHQESHELSEFLTGYFKKGIANKERCIWVISRAHTPADFREHVTQTLNQNNPAMSPVQILGHDEIFVDGSGNLKPWVTLLEGWASMEQQALENGFQGLRIATDTRWVARETWDPFLQYQYLATRALSQRRTKAVSTYLLSAAWRDDIMDVAEIHRAVFARRGQSWHRIATSDRKEVESLLLPLKK